MKFLAVFFVLGIALASAIPLSSNENAVKKSTRALGNFFSNLALKAEDDDVKTELGKKLKERFDEILEKLKEAIENGKTVKEEYLDKLKEIRGKLKDLKVDLGERAKDLLEKLKEKAKDYWKKILDKLNPENADVQYADEDVKTALLSKLKELLDSERTLTGAFLNKKKLQMRGHLGEFQMIIDHLVEKKAGIVEAAKNLIKKLNENSRDCWNGLLDKLSRKNGQDSNDDDVKTELVQKLKELYDLGRRLNSLNDRVREIHQKELRVLIHEGQVYIEYKMATIYETANNLVEKLAENSKDCWKETLDELAQNSWVLAPSS